MLKLNTKLSYKIRWYIYMIEFTSPIRTFLAENTLKIYLSLSSEERGQLLKLEVTFQKK